MKLRGLKDWLPTVAIAIVAVPLLALLVSKCSSGADTQPLAVVATIAVPTPTPFEPVSVNPIIFVTQGPYHVGQLITVRDGICNNSGDVLQGVTIVGFEEQERDRLSTRNIVLLPVPDPSGTASVAPLPRPISPGCLGLAPVTAPLPANLPPGKWQLYINLTIMGAQSGQVQRINDVSPTFEVLP